MSRQLDWNTVNPDSMNEGPRLTTIEVQVKQLERADTDKEIRIRSIEKSIWMAFGATSLLQILIVTFLEWHRG